MNKRDGCLDDGFEVVLRVLGLLLIRDVEEDGGGGLVD